MRTYVVIVPFILLAVASRLYQIDFQSIWFDEGWSAFAAVQPTIQAAVEADPTNPPLYYVLLNLTTRGFGDSPLGLRLTSMLLGLLTIPLAYQLARRLFNVKAGLFATALVTVSPPLWWASQEARMYTLLAVLILVMALAWHQLRIRPTRWAWLMLLLAELGVLYAHNTGPAVVLWINSAMLLDWLVRRVRRQPKVLYWLGGQIIVGLLWLPWFVTRFLDVQGANSALVRRPELNLDTIGRLWQGFWTAPWAIVGAESLLADGTALAFVFTLLLIPWRKSSVRWLMLHSLLLTGGLLLGLAFIGNEMHGRYLVMIVPLLLVALGAGLAGQRFAAVRYVGLLAFATLFVANMVLAQNPDYQHDDVRGMAEYYAETYGPQDTILAWSYADRYDLAYYWRHLNIPAQRVTLPEGADLDEVLPLLPQQGDVGLNVWYTQRADFRGMLGCVLGNSTSQTPREHTVYGMTDYRYALSFLSVPTLRPFERPVLHNGEPIATITRVGNILPTSADRIRCMPVELRLNQPVDTDLRAAVIVRNALGWDVVQASAIFATANQRTSSQLTPGDTMMAYVLFRLPFGAPRGDYGDYEVLLRVFDDRVQPSGYDMTGPSGNIIGKDVSLGMWLVTGGANWFASGLHSILPHEVDLPISEDLTLIGHDLEPKIVTPGMNVRLQLLWNGHDPLPELYFGPEDGSWTVTLLPLLKGHDDYTLDWRELRVPLDAAPGTAQLRLPDGTVLVEYTIDALPLLSEPPDFDVAVGESIPGIAILTGYSSGEAVIGQDVLVTLVWQVADVPIETGYTVFVQLLDSNGRLIAQSDSVPAQGERPTSGWREGEFIVDEHHLVFNDLAEPGEATLIVGMYDAQTGVRVPVTADGQDHIVLPGAVTVR